MNEYQKEKLEKKKDELEERKEKLERIDELEKGIDELLKDEGNEIFFDNICFLYLIIIKKLIVNHFQTFYHFKLPPTPRLWMVKIIRRLKKVRIYQKANISFNTLDIFFK